MNVESFHSTKWNEEGNKSGKLLARIIKLQRPPNKFLIIHDEMGCCIQEEEATVETFKEYYACLYNTEAKAHSLDVKKFLNRIKLPKLTKSDENILEADITLEKIKKMVKEMKSRKAPGGDGLPLEFYVQFGDTLYPEILKDFQDTKKMGSLPPSMREAIIINIPKAGKDPGKLDSYRPISFITADVKILAKILANRLQKVIGGLINKDQTGFIPTRTTYDNILHLFLNIQAPMKKTTNDAILTLDASKAFDRVE